MMAQAALVWELARKDLMLFLADRRGAVLCFAVPILLASTFGLIFKRTEGSADTVRLPLLIVTEDSTPMTRRVVNALLASDRLDASETDRTTALARLEEDGSGVVLVLPREFGELCKLDPTTGQQRPVAELFHHPNSMVESHWAEGVFTEVVMREAAGEWLAPIVRANPGFKVERPFNVKRSAVNGAGSQGLNVYSHSFCGMTLQYLLFWGMDSGLLLLRERRLGIWKRLRAAPIPLAALLAGKALATAIIALAQITLTFGFGRIVFGVTVTGSFLGFLALALAAAGMSSATGLLVAALGGNEGRARSVAIVAILTLSMLSGMWLPSFLLPVWVQKASLALPTTWAVRGFAGVTWQGMG